MAVAPGSGSGGGWVSDPENDVPRPDDPIPLPGLSSGRLLDWYSNSLFLTIVPGVGIALESVIPIPGWGISMLLLLIVVALVGASFSFRSIAKNKKERALGYGTRGGLTQKNPQLYLLDAKTLKVLYRPPPPPRDPTSRM